MTPDAERAAGDGRRGAPAPERRRPAPATRRRSRRTGPDRRRGPQRTEAGQTNVTPRPGGRTTWDIVRGNIFTFFNVILGVLFVVMMVFGNWRDALFGWVIVINSGIGIYQEMRAKLVLDRLNLLTAPAAKVIRDGEDRGDPHRRGGAGRRGPGGRRATRSWPTARCWCRATWRWTSRCSPANRCRCRRNRATKLLSGSFVVAGSGVFGTTAVGSDAYAQRIAGRGQALRAPALRPHGPASTASCG